MQAPEKARPAQAVILDAGAIIALSRDDLRAQSFVRSARGARSAFYLSVVVLTETLTGGPRDATVHRVINAVNAELPLSGLVARRAGRLLGETGSSAGAVDAIVAATAISVRPSVILTTDPDDMRRLVSDHPEVTVYPL